MGFDDYDLPCRVKVKDGLRQGDNIKIKGEVLKTSHKFTVQIDAGDGIPLKMDVDFRGETPEGTVKSRMSKDWSATVAIPNLPFKRGDKFMMEIIARSGQFDIEVDGKPVLKYDYVYPDLHKIDFLRVSGDLETPVGVEVDN